MLIDYLLVLTIVSGKYKKYNSINQIYENVVFKIDVQIQTYLFSNINPVLYSTIKKNY